MHTMRRNWLSLVLALGLGTLPACGGSGGGGSGHDGGSDGSTTDGSTTDGSTTDGGNADGGSSTYTKVTDMEDDLVSTFCSKVTDCMPFIDVIVSPWTCEAMFRMQLHPELVAEQQRVDHGDLTFDPAKARMCLNAIDALSCDEIDLEGNLFDVLQPCREALTGGKSMGESCSQTTDCDPALYCDKSMACPGTCAQPVATGGTCKAGQRCADGQVCFVPASSTDGTGTCTAPVGEGHACDTEMGPPCAGGLRCNTSGSGTSGTCGTEVRITTDARMGQPCGFTGRGMLTLCSSGLVCVLSSSSSGTGTCMAGGLAENASCPAALPDPCGDGLYCDGATDPGTMGTCKKLPMAGEACAAPPGALGSDGPFGDGLCAPGLACDKTASPPTCVEPKANGEDCASSFACASGYCEITGSSSTGTCKDAPACR